MCVALLFLGFYFAPDTSGEWSLNLESLSKFTWRVSSLVVTPDEHVFFLDPKEHHIFHLDENGCEVSVFGREGQGPGEFESAWRIQYLPKDKKLLVYDNSDRTLQAFDLSGRFIQKQKLDQQILQLGRLEFLFADLAVVIDIPNPFREDLGQGARFLLVEPSTKTQTLLMKNDVTRHGDPVVVRHEGRGVSAWTFPWTPRSILAVSPNREVLFMGSTAGVDFTIYDVVKRSFVGRVEDKSLPWLPLTQEEIAQYDERILAAGNTRGIKDFDHPDFRPPIVSAFCDTDTRLWVLINGAFEAQESTYVLFDRHGKKMGLLTIPSEQKLYHATQKHYWCVVDDPDDDEVLIKKIAYRLE